MFDLLRRVPYFSGLSDELLAALAAVAIERRYARGEMVFLEGDPCTALYVVARGEVKIFKVSPQGREQVLHQLGPGSTFNDVAALDGGPNPASVATTADATLLCIPRAELRRLAQAYPALAWALIESLAHRARHLVVMVEDLALRSVKARLAKLLLAEAEATAGQVELDRGQMVTQVEMAARLGTVREMVGRALRELADEGLISLDRHRIVIADRRKLAAVAEGM
ncbi:MAG: Crp/Fnr family transcriptional regulator [Chloroflexi bacterium]|nr:Crp/Fnr family transcriptional regulator [Chloroflexota bacterium]